jgi:hypothetical protein
MSENEKSIEQSESESESENTNSFIESNDLPEALNVQSLRQEVNKLTRIIQQKNEVIRKMQNNVIAQNGKTDIEISRLEPKHLLRYLTVQTPSSVLLHRWLIDNQRDGLPFAHSLLKSLGKSKGKDANHYHDLSRQLLLLIKELPQEERSRFLQSYDLPNSIGYSLATYVFYYGKSKTLASLCLDCLEPASLKTVEHDKLRASKYPHLFSLFIKQIETAYKNMPKELQAFYLQQDGESKTIGHHLYWHYDNDSVTEYFRVLDTLPKDAQLKILSLKDKDGKIIGPANFKFQALSASGFFNWRQDDENQINVYLKAISKFKIIDQLNLMIGILNQNKHNLTIEFSAREIALYSKLSREELANNVSKSVRLYVGLKLLKSEKDFKEGKEINFLAYAKKLTKEAQYQLLSHHKDDYCRVLRLCIEKLGMLNLLDLIRPFSRDEQTSLLTNYAFEYYFKGFYFDTNSQFHHVTDMQQSDLIAYLAVLGNIEPTSKLIALQSIGKKQDSRGRNLIQYACSEKSYPGIIVAFLICLGDDKSPFALEHSNKQALINVIKKHG